jgi:hypothetical protein
MYLSFSSLSTHLYPEIILEITRENVQEYANLAAFPSVGVLSYTYKDLDTGLYYIWDGSGYTSITYVDKVRKAINTGVGEAKSYLNRYDLDAMFSDDDNLRTFQSDLLDNKVKDLVTWHLIRLCNVNVNMELMRTNYEDAIKFFTETMKGNIDPVFPLRADNADTTRDEAGLIEWRSKTKRLNDY